MELVCVDPAQVRSVWPRVSGLIHEAIRRGDLASFKSVEDDVLCGLALLWLAKNGEAIEAAAVTVLEQTEWTKSLVIVACAGENTRHWLSLPELENWRPLLKKIEDYGRAEHCSVARIWGREGWQRVLEDYRPKRVVLEKVL